MPDSIPNSTSTTSVLTVNGATVDSNIDYVGDQDWWRIDLIANTRYQFSLNPFGVDGSGDAYLRLLNASGNQIAYDDDTGGGGSPRSDSLLIFTPTATGNYYLSAEGFNSPINVNVGAYSLRATTTATTTPDKVNGTSITDAGNTIASANTLSGASGVTSITGSVGGSDTNDYYKFVAPGTGIATFALTGLSQDVDLRLRNSSGSSIGYSNVWYSGNENISKGLTAGQTYYIQVDPYGAASNYSLSVTLPSASTTTTTPDKVNGTSITDAGNTTASANTLSGASGVTSITGSVGGSDTNDYYKFVAPGTGIATFALTGLSQDVDLKLLNSSGSIIGYSNDSDSGNENISQGLTAGQTYYIQVDPYGTAASNYSLSVTLPSASTTTTPTISSGDIFNTQGQVGGDGSDTGIFSAGKIRVMADFSKAAYNLQSWETASAGGKKINDPSTYADTAYSEIIAQGWVPLELSPTITATTTVVGQTVTNKMKGGYYTNGNAAAFVARSGDAVVISFRGTNDYGNDNRADISNAIHPDKDDWTFMQRHYNLLKPLINTVDNYIANDTSISKVYVTGHSLGGAMAIEYMGTHSGPKYSSVTFAAPGFAAYVSWEQAILHNYPDRARVTHIEINGDIVPDTGPHGGRTIHFEGNETDEIISSANNHSMDYYRQITDSVDALSWQRILNESGDQEVLLGGQRGLLTWSDRFI